MVVSLSGVQGAAATDAYPVGFNDPQMSGYRMPGQLRHYALQQNQQAGSTLPTGAQNDKSRRRFGRITKDIGKIEISGHEYPSFGFANLNDPLIRRATQRFGIDGGGVKTRSRQQVGAFNRKILIDFEFHAASGMISSFASTAA
jgi:hypothetical protein